ncbi:hypothetical protein [Stenotrophomonas sp.]|uniref:hypothetical protein n=1 Tax=Stenotrophomonas sp. TaxID=69392 RepID=UPI0028ADEC01|nr:hypothetical protein [Stenotrophomonas sp.]
MTFPISLVALFAVANASTAPPTQVATEGAYRYESVSALSFETSVITIDINNKLLVYPATLTELESCPAGRSRCFKTTRMSFCSPTEDEIRTKEWNCGDDDLEFKLTGERTLRILGDEVRTLVVARHGTEYFYNPERGVVMFRFVNQPITEVYWSVDEYGFGSNRPEASK